MKLFAEFNQFSDVQISKRTFDRYARKGGFKRAPNVKKQALRRRHRKARLAWVKARRFLTVNDYWKKIIFSDECTVKIGQNYRVWRRSSEGSYRPDLYGDRLDSKTTIFKVNIWGCISYFGGGTLKVLEGTVQLMLTNILTF